MKHPKQPHVQSYNTHHPHPPATVSYFPLWLFAVSNQHQSTGSISHQHISKTWPRNPFSKKFLGRWNFCWVGRVLRFYRFNASGRRLHAFLPENDSALARERICPCTIIKSSVSTNWDAILTTLVPVSNMREIGQPCWILVFLFFCVIYFFVFYAFQDTLSLGSFYFLSFFFKWIFLF